ncbi:hypothetical protein LTR85_005583 [Meristemomyces frigidus]|nr:hypothetical protein LTR85_005583 [Meristemomyces frigidus]
MPLTERDVNTQRDIPRNKRHSIQRELSYARLKDENSPSLRTASIKGTPPSQRLLAPTKASAAKVSSPPRAPAQSTPQSHSKLPRRAPTPTTVPSTSKWSTRVAERVASTEKVAMEADELSRQGTDDVATSPHPTETDVSRKDKPLPAEKPLPSRPVASFINALSPSKDSRSLLDASEKPLTISLGHRQHAWPTLTPRSTSAPASEMLKDTETEKPRHFAASTILSNGTATIMTAATGLTNVMVGKPSASASEAESSGNSVRTSSSASLHTAKADLRDHATSTSQANANAAGHNDDSYPARQASLRQRISSGSIVSATAGSMSKLTAFTDFTKSGVNAADDSRPHSPSPASFSRPRPGSSSHTRTLTSPSPTTATLTATAAKATRAQKTASRIPLPDVKKATLVDIKSRRSSWASTPKSERGPTFGTRRLDAPDTLKILDQGIKRRQLTQLKRTDTNGSSTTATSSGTRMAYQPATPLLDASRCSSREGTCGHSSSDEEEVTTPIDKPSGLAGHGFKLEHAQQANGYYHDTAVKLFDSAVSTLSRPPPSTSQFTGPLQTIPSQATLPFHTEDHAPPVPTHQRQPSDFASIIKRFSDLHAAHADHTAGYIGDRAAVPESTRYYLMDILSEYEQEDLRLSKEGVVVLDDETRNNITRTLSVLEGNGSPPKTDVNNETLLQMFGHLKRGLEKAPNQASLVENAAAAQKFLAQPNINACSPTAMAGGQPSRGKSHGDNGNSEQLPMHNATKAYLPPLEAVASKWSDSTTSDKGLSQTGMSPQNRYHESKTGQPQPPKRAPPKPPQSIGYPTRVPSKANALLGPGGSGAATPPAPIRRSSSPTLGKRKPGSVRAARETLDQVRGGFARTTASAESKKMAKMSTPNTKAYSVAGDDQRGRVPSAEKSRSKSDSTAVPKTPRSRSKSRYVMDKINGLFSGKREKKYSPAPPIPSIDEDFSADRDVAIAANGSPILRAARGAVGAKMPTLSLSTHPAFRNASRNTSNTSVETPVDSVTASDETQALQNWTAALVNKALRQPDTARKERMLSFAKILNDSLISAREAQICAETAQHAARSAQLSYEMTQKSIDMLQRLAGGFGFGARS